MPVVCRRTAAKSSNVIDEQQMSQIAVNGRAFTTCSVDPGASSQINGFVNTPVGGDSNVEFNGMRQNHKIYLLDGGEDDDRGGAGGMSIAPPRTLSRSSAALTSTTAPIMAFLQQQQ